MPIPEESHHELRIIGQLLTTTRSESYQEDDNNFLANFLGQVPQPTAPSVRVEQLNITPALTKTDRCIFFLHLAGYISHKVVRFTKLCDACKAVVVQKDDRPTREISALVDMKDFKADGSGFINCP